MRGARQEQGTDFPLVLNIASVYPVQANKEYREQHRRKGGGGVDHVCDCVYAHVSA